MPLEVLELKARGVRVRLTSEFSAICPLSKTIDKYVVEIEYVGDGRFIELGSLRQYLDSFRKQEWYHEELCEKILFDLKEVLNTRVRVKLTSCYCGIKVEVEKAS